MQTPPTRLRPVCIALALVAFGGAQAAAQVAPEGADADESIVSAAVLDGADAEPAAASSDGGWSFFGDRSPRRRFIPGMWGVHFFDRASLKPFWVLGGGMQVSGWFLGVFENSYDDLSVIAGVEREWGAWRTRGFGMGAGYRAGLLSGYDGQLLALADKTPVLPFAGLDLWLQAGPVGVDVFYVYRAVSLEASFEY